AGTLVIPGFVDTHRHVWQTAIRGNLRGLDAAQIVMQACANEVEAVFVGGEAVKLGGELVDSGARRAARLAVESRERIVAALEPRGGFLPPAPEGWFDATLDAFEANLAGAPEA
ncbi:MAG: hypothetical protein ABWY90_08805, partial [Solirubrobacterales bacterium]